MFIFFPWAQAAKSQQPKAIRKILDSLDFSVSFCTCAEFIEALMLSMPKHQDKK